MLNKSTVWEGREGKGRRWGEPGRTSVPPPPLTLKTPKRFLPTFGSGVRSNPNLGAKACWQRSLASAAHGAIERARESYGEGSRRFHIWSCSRARARAFLHVCVYTPVRRTALALVRVRRHSHYLPQQFVAEILGWFRYRDTLGWLQNFKPRRPRWWGPWVHDHKQHFLSLFFGALGPDKDYVYMYY